MAMVTDLPVRRLRNILLAIMAMTFLLLNPVIHAILIGAGIFLYRFLIQSEKDAVQSNTKRSSFFRTELVCKASNEANGVDALSSLRKCLFASFYVVSTFDPEILVEEETYRLRVTLVSEKYLNSFIHFLDESGFITVKKQ